MEGVFRVPGDPFVGVEVGGRFLPPPGWAPISERLPDERSLCALACVDGSGVVRQVFREVVRVEGQGYAWFQARMEHRDGAWRRERIDPVHDHPWRATHWAYVGEGRIGVREHVRIPWLDGLPLAACSECRLEISLGRRFGSPNPAERVGTERCSEHRLRPVEPLGTLPLFPSFLEDFTRRSNRVI